MAGRKRIASAVHRAAGTYASGNHPERENKHEPKPTEGAPNKPAHIAGNVAASQYWDHTLQQLADMNLLTKADRSLMEIFSELMALRRQAFIEGDSKACNQLAATIRGYISELGLSPSSRAKLVAKDPVEEDAFSQWQKGFPVSDN